jgi:hypothetical protein
MNDPTWWERLRELGDEYGRAFGMSAIALALLVLCLSLLPHAILPLKIQVRSEVDAAITTANFMGYLNQAHASYVEGAQRLGLHTYSISSMYTAPRLMPAQATPAAEQIAFLRDTLIRLRASCERIGVPGMAEYVDGRLAIAETIPEQTSPASVYQWLREVDIVFVKLQASSRDLAVNPKVLSLPRDGAHFIMITRTGHTEINTLTNKEVQNAYRGLYQYEVTAKGMADGFGEINLIDATGTSITCHLLSSNQGNSSMCEAQ